MKVSRRGRTAPAESETPTPDRPGSESRLQAVPDVIRAAWDACLAVGEVRRVLVGFSGGADSTALLLVLQALAAPGLEAIHFQHGLRGAEAEADAAWCRAFCRARKIPFRLVRLAVKSRRRPGESLEETARKRRLEAWRTLAEETPDTAVALGHHADDALEDLFLRLARGSNVSGLTGLRPDRVVDGVRFLRPLLGWRRAELESWLRHGGVRDWRHDSSNRNAVDFRRNAVRLKLLPLFREIFDGDSGLLAARAALFADADFLEREAAAHFGSVLTPWALAELPLALRGRVLRLWLRRETGVDHIPGQAFLNRLDRDLERWRGGGRGRIVPESKAVPVGGGLTLVLAAAGIRLAQPVVAVPVRRWRWREQPVLDLPEAGLRLHAELMSFPTQGFEQKIQRRKGGCLRCASAPSVEWVSVSAVPPVLTVRTWRAADRMQPFGCVFRKAVGEILADAKVPAGQRRLVPLVLAGRTPLWLPGVRRAETGRLPPAAAATLAVRLSVTKL